jgi:hypothetical protein
MKKRPICVAAHLWQAETALFEFHSLVDQYTFSETIDQEMVAGCERICEYRERIKGRVEQSTRLDSYLV